MLSYIVRRLLIMIPTLFGVTVISFIVMQLAPGDPVLNRLNGATGQSTQTREAFVLQKRELHLDKPLVSNFRWFRDYQSLIAAAAHYRSLSEEQIAAELADLKDHPDTPANQQRLQFLRRLTISEFDKRLADKSSWNALAEAIVQSTMVYCEDIGVNGVPAAIDILEHSDQSREKLGAIRCLSSMVPDPFVYTYSVNHPSQAQTPEITAVWKLWWERNEKKFPKIEAEDKDYLTKKLAEMTKGPDQIFSGIEAIHDDNYDDAARPFFAQALLSKDSTLEQRVAASAYLSKSIARPLVTDLAIDATSDEINQASENWQLQYRLYESKYQPGFLSRVGYVFADTQYAYMVVRLVTFQFGNSTIRTHDPVSGLIWQSFVVSAPLMLMAELIIYFLAVPLGILCGVFRGRAADQLTSLVLFLLYSIPPFVAGMLFLVYFCYGDYLHWFPMMGLHSDNADSLGFVHYLLDYFWHAFLPVVCLSLFSLAAVAMYSRSAILDVINQDYIRTAKAKGLAGPVIVMKHALRNALIPILTLFSSFLPAMLGGSVLIEVIFSIHGLGFLGFESILQKDYPTLMALLYIEALLTLFSFLITDLLYVVVDPRISFDAGA